MGYIFSSVHFSCSVMSNTASPWTVTHQASLSITNSQSLLKLMSVKLVMPSNHLLLCRPLLLLLQSFPASGERNGKPLQHSCLENPMNSMKRLRPWLTAIDVGSRKERGQAQGGGRSRPGSLTHSFLHLDALSCPALPSTHQSHLPTRL